MGHSFLRRFEVALLSATSLALTTSCTGGLNPLLPSARVLVTAQPQVVPSKITYSRAQDKFNYENKTVQFTLAAFPGDVTPGVLFTDATVRFLDQEGSEISDSLIPKQRHGVSIYIPKGGGRPTTGGVPATGNTLLTGVSAVIEIPVVPESVTRYGIDNGFRNSGTETQRNIAQNPDPWSQSITGEVTFIGRDDNQNAITAVGKFTVNFQTDITP